MVCSSNPIPAIRHLLPAGTVISGGDLRPSDGNIFPEEEKLVASAVEKRRREFFAGRIYARQALLELGQDPVPILRTSGRAPIWPDGFVGSISHCASVCAAIVALASNFRGVGLDIDHDTPLGGDVTRLVCRPAEIVARNHKERLLGMD